MLLTIDLDTMTVKEKMLLVGKVLRSCEKTQTTFSDNEKQMLGESMQQKKNGAKLTPLSELDNKIRARYV